MGETICPRCGHRDSFTKGYLPDTCVCRICMSQLDWREIPGAGPDCLPLEEERRPPTEPSDVATGSEDSERGGEGAAGATNGPEGTSEDAGGGRPVG